ncbi:hypothetical protein ACFPU0_04640 [Pseudomonas sp. GCM10022186]|uniref:hypothetical protein n=1 Tax=Pseudomonas sp. GCM10022186 TaxID=3252650 RepID=UPI00360724E6
MNKRQLATPRLAGFDEAVMRWLESDEAYRQILDAAAEAKRAIDKLNESREVGREELHRPITLM